MSPKGIVQALERLGFCLEIRLGLEAHHLGDDVTWEGLQARVIAAREFVEVSTLHGYAVLGAFDLVLQRQLVATGLQLWVVLDHREQHR